MQTDPDNNNKEKKDRLENVKKFIGTEHIVKNHEAIKDVASNLLSVDKQLKNARVENFKTAMERLGTSYDDLPKIHFNYMIQFYISIIAFSGLLLYGTHVYFSNGGLLHTLACLSIGLLCLVNSFRFSFRCFQIKHQKLCSIQDFLKNRDFFPTKLK